MGEMTTMHKYFSVFIIFFGLMFFHEKSMAYNCEPSCGPGMICQISLNGEKTTAICIDPDHADERTQQALQKSYELRRQEAEQNRTNQANQQQQQQQQQAPAAVNCAGPCQNGTYRDVGGRCECVGGEGIPPNVNSQIECTTTYGRLVDQCRAEIASTESTCDEKNDSQMSSVTNQMSQMALAIGNQTSGSIQAACSKMAKLSQAANAAVAGYRFNCSSAIEACNSKCGELSQYFTQNLQCITGSSVTLHAQLNQDVSSMTRSCQSYTAKTNEATQAMQNFVATSANASKCSELTDGTGNKVALCNASPTSPGCLDLVDCKNPMMAKNKICICNANPASPECLPGRNGNSAILENSFVGSDYYDGSSRLGESSMDFSTDVPNTPSIAMGERPADSSLSLDGKQGDGSVSGAGGGAGGGGAPGSGDQGDEGSALSKDINGGFHGGRGSFGGGGSNSSSRSTAGVGYGAGNSIDPKAPDLRKFLPAGQFDPRRGAGLGGLDGITGPHTNIWKKIHNRYQVMKPSLLP